MRTKLAAILVLQTLLMSVVVDSVSANAPADEMIECWMPCVLEYGMNPVFNGVEYKMSNCYRSGPTECTCEWVPK